MGSGFPLPALCSSPQPSTPVAVEGFLLQGQPGSGAWHRGDRSLHESCLDACACVPLSVHRPLYFLLLYSAHKQERCSLLTLGFPRAASGLCVMPKEAEVWAEAGRGPGLASQSLAGAFLSFATQQANAFGSVVRAKRGSAACSSVCWRVLWEGCTGNVGEGAWIVAGGSALPSCVGLIPAQSLDDDRGVCCLCCSLQPLLGTALRYNAKSSLCYV